MHITTEKLIMPLFRAQRTGASSYASRRFIGSSTLFDGNLCTYKHVITAVPAGEFIFAWNETTDERILFEYAKLHPVYDFAVLIPSEPRRFDSLPVMRDQLHPGVGVHASGYNGRRVIENPGSQSEISITARVFAGNIVSMGHSPSNVARTVNELSFPTLSGFSGAPLVIWGPEPHIAGMVYGNAEESITVFSITDTIDGQTKFSESIARIVEYGLFHSVPDIFSYLEDIKGNDPTRACGAVTG